MLGSVLPGSRGVSRADAGQAHVVAIDSRVDSVTGYEEEDAGQTGRTDASTGAAGDAEGIEPGAGAEPAGAEPDTNAGGEAVTAECCAEEIRLYERLITAPTAGTFHPTFSDITVDNPVMIAVGDEIGVLVQSGEKHTVESPFTGLLMGLIALPGERVRAHQPLAWLTTDDDLLWGWSVSGTRG